MNKKYNLSLDVLRIIAGIGVVVIHVAAQFLNYPPFFATPTFWIANILESAARPAVPVFIMISGYLLLDPGKKYTFLGFFKKRLSKIGIPVIVWPVLFIFWNAYFLHEKIQPVNIPQMFVFMTISYHLYFLYLILGLYIFTPFIKIFTDNASHTIKKYFLSVLFILLGIMTFLNYFFMAGVFAFSTIFTFFIPYIPYFITGDYFRSSSITKKKLRIFITAFIILVFLTSVANFFYMKSVGWNNTLSQNPDLNRYFYDYFSPNVIIMACLVFVIFLNNPLFLKLPKFLPAQLIKEISASTFGVYLIHPMILDLLDKVRFLNLGYIATPVWSFMILKIVLCVAVSYAIVFVVRKIVVLKYVFGS